MMVEHDDLETEADEYPRLPVNLHVAARASIALATSTGLGAGVTSGADGAGLARTDVARVARAKTVQELGDFILMM